MPQRLSFGPQQFGQLGGLAVRLVLGRIALHRLLPLGNDGCRKILRAAQLRAAGFALAATLVDGGANVFSTALPQRLVYVMGAEAEGMDRALAAACDLQVSIPGSGAVESLNVASATAVLLAQWAASPGT